MRETWTGCQMQDNRSEENNVPEEEVKSPAKGFALLFGGLILIAILLIILGNAIADSLGPGEHVQKMRRQEVAARMQPVGQVNTNPNAAVASVPSSSSSSKKSSGPMSGQEVYQHACSTCHGSGALGSPKFRNTKAWTPHAKKGLDTLFHHAINGFKKMPPRGGFSNLSDQDVKNGVKYMLQQAKVFDLAKKK